MENENLNKYAYWDFNFNSSGYGEGDYYNCSACNFSINIPYTSDVNDYNFCPHCGRTIIHKTYKKENKQ